MVVVSTEVAVVGGGRGGGGGGIGGGKCCSSDGDGGSDAGDGLRTASRHYHELVVLRLACMYHKGRYVLLVLTVAVRTKK